MTTRLAHWIEPDVRDDVEFIAAGIPGRFDAPYETKIGGRWYGWRPRFNQARRLGAGFVAFTEATEAAPPALVKRLTAGIPWAGEHLTEPWGASNCMALWNVEEWGRVWADERLLTAFPLFRKNGGKIPPTFALCVLLRNLRTTRLRLFILIHLPLENTPNRRKAKAEALAALGPLAHNIRAELRATGIMGPDDQAPSVVLGDWNINFRRAAIQRWFLTTFPDWLPAWRIGGLYSTHGGPRGGHLDTAAVSRRLVIVRVLRIRRRLVDPFDHITQLFAVRGRRPTDPPLPPTT